MLITPHIGNSRDADTNLFNKYRPAIDEILNSINLKKNFNLKV